MRPREELWDRSRGEHRPLRLPEVEGACNDPGIVWAKGTPGRQEESQGSVSVVVKNKALGNLF